jgi:hypothetical protein
MAEQRSDDRKGDHDRQRDEQHRADGERDTEKYEGEKAERRHDAEHHAKGKNPSPPSGYDDRFAILLYDKHDIRSAPGSLIPEACMVMTRASCVKGRGRNAPMPIGGLR